ncbi:hypothetical protein [Paraburkholderia bannensis]|uniref:hypothetical protein n=1 Tax=Paraburkholderia bannensis TaxID=765414 RepID=UPI002AC33AF1|nr:hypothetical protein [Paraburkholderia bannensis]
MAGNEHESESGPQDFAASQFSADEMRVLFTVLGVDFDSGDEDRHKLAVERLAEALRDKAQTETLLAALKAAGEPSDVDLQRNDAFKPSRSFHPDRATDSELLDNPPTVGKVMDAAVDVRARILEGSLAEFSGKVARGGSVVHAPLSTTPNDEVEQVLFSRPGSAKVQPVPEALRHWTKFACEVDHVLQEHETLWGRLSAFFHRSNMISRWEQTDPTWLDLYLQEGRRRWLFQIHFAGNNDVLWLIVAGDARESRRVSVSDPQEFSKLLIDTFDGDISPARLALTSVQQAIEASIKVSLH